MRDGRNETPCFISVSFSFQFQFQPRGQFDAGVSVQADRASHSGAAQPLNGFSNMRKNARHELFQTLAILFAEPRPHVAAKHHDMKRANELLRAFS